MNDDDARGGDTVSPIGGGERDGGGDAFGDRCGHGGRGPLLAIPAGADGGADRAKFALTTAGVLTFKAAKDYAWE